LSIVLICISCKRSELQDSSLCRIWHFVVSRVLYCRFEVSECLLQDHFSRAP